MPVLLIAKSLQDTGSEFTADLLPGSRSRLSDLQRASRRPEQGASSLRPSRSGIDRFHFFPDFGEKLKVCRCWIANSVEVRNAQYFSHHLIPSATTADLDITPCHGILPTGSAQRLLANNLNLIPSPERRDMSALTQNERPPHPMTQLVRAQVGRPSPALLFNTQKRAAVYLTIPPLSYSSRPPLKSSTHKRAFWAKAKTCGLFE